VVESFVVRVGETPPLHGAVDAYERREYGEEKNLDGSAVVDSSNDVDVFVGCGLRYSGEHWEVSSSFFYFLSPSDFLLFVSRLSFQRTMDLVATTRR
jgi:hypothetical protein